MAEFTGEGLACVRGERAVFTALSFRVTDGGALILAGPNGAGKSSLLRIMAGLLPPVDGLLVWDGSPIAADPEAHRRRVRYIAHADAVKPALTVAENLRNLGRALGRPGRGRGARDGGAGRLGDRPAVRPARPLSIGGTEAAVGARSLACSSRAAVAAGRAARRPRCGCRAASGAVIERHRDGGGMVVMALHGGRRPVDAPTLNLSGMAKC